MVVKYKYLVSVSENASNSQSELRSEFTRSFDSEEELHEFNETFQTFIEALSQLCPAIKFDKMVIMEDIDV